MRVTSASGSEVKQLEAMVDEVFERSPGLASGAGTSAPTGGSTAGR